MRRPFAWRFRPDTWPRVTGYTGALDHDVLVPAGPDGRPGERLRAPSRSLYAPRGLGRDGSREDFRVLVGEGASTFAAVCLGPVAERGDPESSAWRTLRHLDRKGFSDSSRVLTDTVAGEEAFRYRVLLRSQLLLEWKFAHAGWLFVAGVRCGTSDNEFDVVGRARDALDTWRWAEVLSSGGGHG